MIVALATTKIAESAPRERGTEATHPIKIVTTAAVVLVAAVKDVAEKVNRAPVNVPPEHVLQPLGHPHPLGRPSPGVIAAAVHAARPIVELLIAIASQAGGNRPPVGHPIAGQLRPDAMNVLLSNRNPKAVAVAAIVAASAVPPASGRPASCNTLHSPPEMWSASWSR